MTNTLPLSTLLSAAWRRFAQHFRQLFWLSLVELGTIILLALLIALLGFGWYYIYPNITVIVFVFGALFILSLILLETIFSFSRLAIIATDISWRPALRASYSRLPRLLLGQLLAALLVVGGFGLLGVPGIILAMLFIFLPFELMLKDKSLSQSLRQSLAHSLGHLRTIWWRLGLVALGLALLRRIFGGDTNNDSDFRLLSQLVEALTSWFWLSYTYELYSRLPATRPLSTFAWRNLVIGIVLGWLVLLIGGYALFSIFGIREYLLPLWENLQLEAGRVWLNQ